MAFLDNSGGRGLDACLETGCLLIRGGGNKDDIMSSGAGSVLCAHGALEVDQVDGSWYGGLIVCCKPRMHCVIVGCSECR